MNFLDKFNKLVPEDKIGIVLSILSIIALLITLYYINSLIWIDEAFTIAVTKKPIFAMFDDLLHDIHPPFYYVILNFVFSVFSFLKISIDEVILAKLVSAIPMILLMIFSFTKLRKEFGWLFSGIFALCIITMPHMMIYSIEVRMYSWALLFTTLTMFYAYKITIGSKKVYWVLLTIFSSLAMYTVYNSFFGILLIYLALLVWIILKNKDELKKWLLSSISTVILYIPGLIFLINNMATMGQFHLIHEKSLLLMNVQTFIYVFFDVRGWLLSKEVFPYYSFDFLMVLKILAAFLLAIAFLVLLYNFIIKKRETSFLNYGIIIFPLSIILGIVISGLMGTAFPLHVLALLGIFWISFSFLLSKSYSNKKIFLPLIIILLFSSFVTIGSFVQYEQENRLCLEFR